jgi:hypothetical protein
MLRATIQVEFFEIAIPDPLCLFSVGSYNELRGFSTKVHYNAPGGSGGTEICLANVMCAMALAKQISAPPQPPGAFLMQFC